jgi:ABC-type sugar transport system substrate-binding protein
VVFLAVVMGLLAASLLSAYPEQEVESKKEEAVIGAAYTSLASGFYFEGIYYQSFDQAMKRSLVDLARKRGFGLLEAEGGYRPHQITPAIRSLIDEGAQGIILCLCRPAAIQPSINVAHEAGVPMVLKGIRMYPGLDAPFVGNDALATGKALGAETARVYQKYFSEQSPHIAIANNRSLERNRQLEEGFVQGFSRVISEPRVTKLQDDNGAIMNVREVALAGLTQHPDANVYFGTSDLRTEGIMLALEQRARGTIETELVASAGGTEEAMNRLLEPESAWKVEAGYSIAGQVEKAYEVLVQMIRGEIPIDSQREYLVDSVILSEPDLEEVRAYLRDHQAVRSFTPR